MIVNKPKQLRGESEDSVSTKGWPAVPSMRNIIGSSWGAVTWFLRTVTDPAAAKLVCLLCNCERMLQLARPKIGLSVSFSHSLQRTFVDDNFSKLNHASVNSQSGPHSLY